MIFDPVSRSVTLEGVGLLSNGLSTSFVATAVDNGAAALDSFAIVPGTGYMNRGPLLDGVLALH